MPYSLADAAAILRVSRSTLRRAIKAEVVEATATGSGSGRRYQLTEDQLEAAKALRCLLPGCDKPAPTESRCCSPAHARKVGLRVGEWSATAAAKRIGWAVQTLTRKIAEGEVAGRIIESPSGPTYALADETVRELAERRCSEDGCDEPAGPTGRCDAHPVGKVERSCQRQGCSETRLVARSAVERGKGKYCSHACNLEAQRRARPESFPNMKAVRAGIAEHWDGAVGRAIAELRQRGWRDADEVAEHFSVTRHAVLGPGGLYRRGALVGVVHTCSGSRVLLFQDEAVVSCEKHLGARAKTDRRQLMQLDPGFRLRREEAAGRVVTLDDARELEARVEAYRKLCLRHNRGKGEESNLEPRLIDAAERVLQDVPETMQQYREAIALLDWQAGFGPAYSPSPSDRDSIDPLVMPSAADRIRKSRAWPTLRDMYEKALQIDRNEIAAA